MSTVLKTDAYEFTMLSSLVERGMADTHSVCELFARKLPRGRRFGIQAGLGRVLKALKNYEVTDDDIATLVQFNLITPKTVEWLEVRKNQPLFNGALRAYDEGSFYNAFAPIVQTEGALGEVLLLETFLLSVYNHDSAIASAAARMVLASNDRPIVEMGSRRTDDEAAVNVARSSYIAGFASTSNVEAARRFDIPTSGTASHAFTLSHKTEEEAFLSQLKAWGSSSTLLVDTYDTSKGIRTAVEVANQLGATGPGAIRIDSGVLLDETNSARRLLDELGATETRIVVSSDLDEYTMTELISAPIDGYGVGTRVATGSGHPTAEMVYKLVEVDGRSVAKNSCDKISLGGKKTPYRVNDKDFYSLNGVIHGEKLLHDYVVNGEVIKEPTIIEIRELVRKNLAALPEDVKKISDGPAWNQTDWDGVQNDR